MENKSTTIEITPFQLGPIGNNTFLVHDPTSKEAAIIDPSFDIQPMIDDIKQQDLRVRYILITHAHFDHIAGVSPLLNGLPIKPILALHQADLELWKDCGMAPKYGFHLDPLPEPDLIIREGDKLSIGFFNVLVHHTPGHSPGHVIFSIPHANALFVGDVIFAGSIGRTDLAGGDLDQLISSIRKSILCYPDETRLFTGHGPETTIGFERLNNPYFNIKWARLFSPIHLPNLSSYYFANSTERVSRMTVTLI